ncbi:MAG: class I tRNA ligase family protein, partial [Oscillochloris sp.]|nr:class I tRNA ligase family protein [Oscillochloris sp.]
PGALSEADSGLIAQVEAGITTVGEALDAARFKAALSEAMRLAGLVNIYLSDQEPWKVIKADRDRAATIWYTALRCVDTLKIFFTPFLPFSSQRLHEYLGYDGYLAGPLEFKEYTEADGRSHRVLTGDYERWVGSWDVSALPVGQALREPKPLFRKLDEKVVEEELARLGA